MKVIKFFLVIVFAIFLAIAILFGVLLTLGGIEMFFDELKIINETLATSLSMSIVGLFITIVASLMFKLIFKKFILED